MNTLPLARPNFACAAAGHDLRHEPDVRRHRDSNACVCLPGRIRIARRTGCSPMARSSRFHNDKRDDQGTMCRVGHVMLGNPDAPIAWGAVQPPNPYFTGNYPSVSIAGTSGQHPNLSANQWRGRPAVRRRGSPRARCDHLVLEFDAVRPGRVLPSCGRPRRRALRRG